MYLKPCLILLVILLDLIKGITFSYKPCLACVTFAESPSWGVVGLKRSPTAEVTQDTGTARGGPLHSSCVSFVQNSVVSRDTENLAFWISRNLIYLITGLSNHPSNLCVFLVNEETFANCMCGMQRFSVAVSLCSQGNQHSTS